MLVQFEDFEIAQISSGLYTFPSNSTIPILDLSTHSSLSHSTSTSLPITLPELPPTLFIGDLKLTALKARLAKIGIAAEFAGEGVLVCGDAEEEGEDGEVVAVRKGEGGRVEVEGGVGRGEVFVRVRREVYGLHAMVEG